MRYVIQRAGHLLVGGEPGDEVLRDRQGRGGVERDKVDAARSGGGPAT